MATAGAVIGGPEDPGSDAQSTVALLDEDANDDLHNVPLSSYDPHGVDVSCPDCAVPLPPPKEITSSTDSEAERREELTECLTDIFCLVMVLIVLSIFCFLLYLIYAQVHQGKLLQSLSEKLESQTNLLHKMLTNQHFPGSNSTST